MVAAVIAGGPVGFGTIIVAFFTGPLISWWNDHISNPMVKTINDATKPKEERDQNSAVLLLSHIGKRTYNTIYNALQTTETMRNHLNQYSTSELRSQLKIVHRNMANSKEMYDSFVEQEKLLQDELNKRIAKAKNK